MKLAPLGLLAFSFAVSCGATTDARPHDMSANAHASAAAAEASAAAAHSAQYAPGRTVVTKRCGGITRAVGEPCWVTEENPTREHLDEAERHARMAADHRAASQALRDAEARACAGLAPADRDQSPFFHRADIVSVEEIAFTRRGPPTARTEPLGTPEGVIITMRAVPGATVEVLQRIVDCHLARNAALGHDVPEMAYCPLVPNGVTATVTPAAGGFAITIRSDDARTAAEIVRRARALKPAS